MKHIKFEELPKILTDEIIETLAHMSNEIPPTNEWKKISSNLSDEDFWRVADKKSEIQMREHREWWESLSEEERAEEKRKRQDALDNPDRFYGNMGNPEYP